MFYLERTIWKSLTWNQIEADVILDKLGLKSTKSKRKVT